MRLLLLLAAFVSALDGSTFSVPQVVDGSVWKTTLTVFARSYRGAQVTVTFYDENGRLLGMPIAGAGVVTSTQFGVGPYDSVTLETEGTAPATTVGWALIESDNDIGGVAVFRQRVAGRPDYEAAVPFTVPSAQVMSTFDNASGFATGVAVVNNSAFPVTVNIGFTAEGGDAISTRVLSMNPRTHMSFTLPERFPEVAGKRGTVSLTAITAAGTVDGSVSVLGLRFNPGGAFTTLPYFISILR